MIDNRFLRCGTNFDNVFEKYFISKVRYQEDRLIIKDKERCFRVLTGHYTSCFCFGLLCWFLRKETVKRFKVSFFNTLYVHGVGTIMYFSDGVGPDLNACHLQSTLSNNLSGFLLCVWGFTTYQQYFSYLTARVHKSMFPGLFLASTYSVHYPDTGGPVVVLFP